jgi:hypothetical protein
VKDSENYFITLNSINVNDHKEKKNGLDYLSWAWAWGEVKKLFPDATYTVYEAANGCIYHTDGRTCWVKTGVTINGIEHIEYLPVMNHMNKSISADAVTSFDVNKAIQRSITKACARHGLGLYIYAGEDLPEDEEPPKKLNPNVGTITIDQVDVIYQIAAPIQIAALEKKYGNNLERMSEAKAAEAIAKLKGEA